MLSHYTLQPQAPAQSFIQQDDQQKKIKELYSISYFSSSGPSVQNTSPQIANKPSNTSIIFHEYHSTPQEVKVSEAEFFANYYGNGDSNSVGSPLVKICKMELAKPITIGSCVIHGERNYIDINDNVNKTRIHIDNNGAIELENYRILVREQLENFKNTVDFESLDEIEFKNLKNVDEIKDFLNKAKQPEGVKVTNDNGTLDAFADTFISNNLKAGRFKTEILNSQGVFEYKHFAYVKIERPINDDKKINVTVSDIHSAELNSININAGKNNGNEEVFFQLSVKKEGEKQVINQDSLKYFRKDGKGVFVQEKEVEGGKFWGLKNKIKLGNANQKIIKIYTHKEEDNKPTLKYKIQNGKFVKALYGLRTELDTEESMLEKEHGNQKVKCGEPNEFTGHDFMKPQSRSASPPLPTEAQKPASQQSGQFQEGPHSESMPMGGGVAHGAFQASTMPPKAQFPWVAPMETNVFHGQQLPLQYTMTQPPMGGGMPMGGGTPMMAPPLDPGIWNKRPPTQEEVRIIGALPNVPVVVRPGDLRVDQGGVTVQAIQVRGGLPPIITVPNSYCHPLVWGPIQQEKGPGQRPIR